MKFLKLIKKRYKYNKTRYKGTFLANNAPQRLFEKPLEPAKSVVYCFWTGDNKLSINRKNSLATMQKNIGVELILITQDNINEYILEDYPLHPSFNNLSFVHRSDYLRTYFMYHYGGGYMDIKSCNTNWSNLFNELNSSDCYALGYSEIGEHGVAQLDGVVGEDLRRYWRYIIGNGAYIFRPHTPMAYEWYSELLKRMDSYSSLLAQHPGNAFGDNVGYPIPWTNILGDIFHPLCLKYGTKLIHNNQIKPDFSKDYR